MKIYINSELIETDIKSSRDFFKQYKKSDSDVCIINGYATSDDIVLKENDELFCIEKGVIPPQKALQAMMKARHTPKLADKLSSACVAVAGLGGLGSNIAIMLARSGIGKLILIDFDIVEPSNLNRQFYFIKDLGKKKTFALRRIIRNINPFIEIKIHNIKIEPKNIKYLFKNANIVCEAFDNPFAKAMLASNFHNFHKDKILISASGMAGFGDSNSIQTKKITDKFYVCGDLKSAAKIGMGLMAPRVNICAAHQANLVLSLLGEKNE